MTFLSSFFPCLYFLFTMSGFFLAAQFLQILGLLRKACCPPSILLLNHYSFFFFFYQQQHSSPRPFTPAHSSNSHKETITLSYQRYIINKQTMKLTDLDRGGGREKQRFLKFMEFFLNTQRYQSVLFVLPHVPVRFHSRFFTSNQLSLV